MGFFDRNSGGDREHGGGGSRSHPGGPYKPRTPCEFSRKNVNLEGVIVQHLEHYILIRVDKYHTKDAHPGYEMAILRARITNEMKVIDPSSFSRFHFYLFRKSIRGANYPLGARSLSIQFSADSTLMKTRCVYPLMHKPSLLNLLLPASRLSPRIRGQTEEMTIRRPAAAKSPKVAAPHLSPETRRVARHRLGRPSSRLWTRGVNGNQAMRIVHLSLFFLLDSSTEKLYFNRAAKITMTGPEGLEVAFTDSANIPQTIRWNGGQDVLFLAPSQPSKMRYLFINSCLSLSVKSSRNGLLCSI